MSPETGTHQAWCMTHSDGQDLNRWGYCSSGERFRVGTELITDINDAAA